MFQLFKQRQKNFGFTLVEVVISMAILSMVSITATPKYYSMVDEAKYKAQLSTVASVQSGIYTTSVDSILQRRSSIYPRTLDNAVDGFSSNANQFFTNVLSSSKTDGWQKNGLTYISPSGTTYTYDPDEGTFSNEGLIYEYSFEEGQDNNVVGIGSYQGQLKGNVERVKGKVGEGLLFDGKGSNVKVSDTASLDLAETGSIEVWIYAKSIPPFAGIVHKGDKSDFSDEAYSLQFWLNNQVALIVNNGNNYTMVTSKIPIELNTWYHVVGSWDSKGMRIYINGVENNSTQNTTVAQNSSGGLHIGSQTEDNYSKQWLNLPFDGIIDEVSIYDKAIGASEIKEHYLSDLKDSTNGS